MPDFTAHIPGRPPDAPGDVYPGDDADDWKPYFNRVVDERGFFDYAKHWVRITLDTVTLAVGGAEPSDWEAVRKTETTIAGVKADYTTYRRHYPRVTFQLFQKVTLEAYIHVKVLPASHAEDFRHRDVWFVPQGVPWSKGELIEVRDKLSSWGAGASVSAGSWGGLEVGVELDFSHEGEDLTPPSPHPAPKAGNLKPDDTRPDVSLEDHVGRPAPRLHLAGLITPEDRRPLSSAETAAIEQVTVAGLADLGIEQIRTAIAEDRYPGLARFLIAYGQERRELDQWAHPPRPDFLPAELEELRWERRKEPET